MTDLRSTVLLKSVILNKTEEFRWKSMKLQTNQRPPLKPKTLEFQIDYSDSQLTFYKDAPEPDFEIFEDHPLD